MYKSYERYYDPLNGYCKSEGIDLQYLMIDEQRRAHKGNQKKTLKNLFHWK